MPGQPSKPPPLPDQVDASRDAISNRIQQRLLPLASVWFPTRRELRAWEQAGVPLYARRVAADRFEIGPRLASMWAACFAPVWVVRLHEEADGTRLAWGRRPVWFTAALLAGWWSIIAGWPVALAADPEEAGRWGVFWAFLLVASTLGPAVGWWMGARSLDAAAGWLAEALTQADVDEDW